MRSEAEVRNQLDETRNAMKQFQEQLSAAANQEWALMFALGEVDTPQPEPPQLGQADPPQPEPVNPFNTPTEPTKSD